MRCGRRSAEAGATGDSVLLFLALLARRHRTHAGINPLLLVQVIDGQHRDRWADPFRVGLNLDLDKLARGLDLVASVPIWVLLEISSNLLIGSAEESSAVVALGDIQRHGSDAAVRVQLVAAGKN